MFYCMFYFTCDRSLKRVDAVGIRGENFLHPDGIQMKPRIISIVP